MLPNTGTPGTPRTTRNVLLLAAMFKLPYRVLRCLAALDATIYVLGTPEASDLRYSRFCKKYYRSTCPLNGSSDSSLADEINLYARRLDIDVIVAGDAPCTRSLIAVKDLISCRCFPMPTLRRFDTLNNKWEFYNVCKRIGLPCPTSELIATKEELIQKVEQGKIATPLVAKPLSMDGGRGCVILQQETYRQRLRSLGYAPIFVQQFICGETVSATAYCEHGVIQDFICYQYDQTTFSTFYDNRIYADVAKLAHALEYEGVINFDIILSANHNRYYLECNPRFFYSVAICMLAGINFTTMGLTASDRHSNWQTPRGSVKLSLPKAAIGAILRAPWKVPGTFLQSLKFLVADPLPFLLEKIGRESHPAAWDLFTASLVGRRHVDTENS